MKGNERDIFQTIFENSNDALLFIENDGTVRHANSKAFSYLRCDNSIKGKKISQVGIFDERTNKDLVEFFNSMKDKEQSMKEIRVRFYDGDDHWVKLKSKIIRSEIPDQNGYVINISNISKEKKYAEAIREGQQKYQLVVENLHEGLCLADKDENIIYCNDALGRILDYDSTELIGRNLKDLMSVEEVKIFSERSKDRMMGITGEYEIKMFSRNGEEKRIKISAAPWYDTAGKYKGSVGLLHDMTETVNQNYALKESEEKYRATVEQSADNIYIYDIETKSITESNKALEDLLGYTKDEIRGMKATDFVFHGTSNIKTKIDLVRKNGSAIIGERKYRKKDGTLVDVDVSATLISQGKKEKLCVVSRDITDRKRYQQQLIIERNRAEFYLDLLAHDMGNMLHGIKNGLDLYEMIEDEKKKKNTLGIVSSLAERSIRLSRDILTFSRIKDGSPKLKRIDIKERILNSYCKACDSLSLDCPGLDMDFEEGLTFLGESMIEEAFFNLFHNSLKAQRGKEIYIGAKTRRESDMIRIEICDHGGGIPEEIKPNLFNRFKEDQIIQSSGIGMTIVKMVVERCEGTIELEDISEGGRVIGTRFVIWFPDRE